METKKIGWYVFLFGIILGIADYFDAIGYLSGNPREPLFLYEWFLTPLFWATIALIIVGVLMMKFGRREPFMPVTYR